MGSGADARVWCLITAVIVFRSEGFQLWAELPAGAGKGNWAIDTGLHRRQGEFMKGASQLTPGCGGTFFQLAPSGIPPADPPLCAGRLASVMGAAGAGVPRW